MSGYLAKRLIKIEGVDYQPGDTVPLSALLPDEFKNLVRRGHIGTVEQGGDATEQINAAIADLIDSAPETLDTLNEIAAAIGDNPNFYTYVDQDVTSGSAPVFDATNFTNLPSGGASSLDELSDVGLNDNSGSATNPSLYIGADVPVTNTGLGRNIAISADGTALDAVTTGNENVVIGNEAASAATTINESVVIGYQAQESSGSYGEFVAIGYKARVSNNYNVAIGSEANCYGTYGVALGASAKTGTYGVTVGRASGSSMTSGAEYNAVFGHNAGPSITTGDSNTIIGSNANVDLNIRNDSVVVGRSLTSGAEDGSIAIGSNNVPNNILRVESGVLTVGGVEWISKSTLQTETAAATDFADFQTRIAAL